MTGLTMCTTTTCHLRAMCLRFMAAPSYGQTWSEWKPRGKKCSGLINVNIQKRKKGA